MLFGAIFYLCCNKKKKEKEYEQNVPLRKEKEVEVQRPVVRQPQPQPQVVYQQQPVRVSRQIQEQPRTISYREPQSHYSQPVVVNEYTTRIGEGERVLVETRHYSPGRDREPRIEYHQHEDWARYSQTHWRNH